MRERGEGEEREGRTVKRKERDEKREDLGEGTRAERSSEDKRGEGKNSEEKR